MKRSTKKTATITAWAVVKLEDGTVKLPKTEVEFAGLVSKEFEEHDAKKVEWTFDGEEWFSATPDTWDIYWL